jgi:Zn-dependent M28 family amino/carboxypeptidase
MPDPVYDGEARVRLQRHVSTLATDIGERNLRDEKRRRALQDAREYVAAQFTSTGFEVHRQRFSAGDTIAENLIVELPGGKPDSNVVIVGAHYDTARDSPGANDNASGVAALLEVGRMLSRGPLRSSVRLVAFCTEEPPFTRKPAMGSRVYARECRRRGDAVAGMLSLETIGYYSDDHRARHAPFPLNVFSPWRADFLAVVGNLRSRQLVAQTVEALEQTGSLRCKGLALPGVLPGVKSSDHWSFWKEGYPAIMITDTAFVRYRHYHRRTDTAEKLEYDRLARATSAISSAVQKLATG